MMKSEFESLAGRNVTDEQYKAIETLYMSSNLEKAEFVKSIRTMLKSIPQPEKKKDIKRMAVRDRSGYRKTPNGCYYHIEYVELVDIDIKTGKYIIKPLEDKDFEQLAKDGHDLNLNTWFDFDYEDCIDEKKRPIELNYWLIDGSFDIFQNRELVLFQPLHILLLKKHDKFITIQLTHNRIHILKIFVYLTINNRRK